MRRRASVSLGRSKEAASALLAEGWAGMTPPGLGGSAIWTGPATGGAAGCFCFWAKAIGRQAAVPRTATAVSATRTRRGFHDIGVLPLYGTLWSAGRGGH